MMNPLMPICPPLIIVILAHMLNGVRSTITAKLRNLFEQKGFIPVQLFSSPIISAQIFNIKIIKIVLLIV